MPQLSKTASFSPSGMSVYVRLLLVSAAITIIISAILLISSAQVSNRMAAEHVQLLGKSNASAAATDLGGAVRFGDVDKVRARIAAMVDGSDGLATAAAVYNLQGALVGDYAIAGATVGSDAAQLAATAVTGTATVVSDDGAMIATPIPVGAEGALAGALVSVWSVEAQMAELRAMQLRIGTIAGVTFIALLCAAAFLMRNLVGAPLKNIEDAVTGLSNGDYDSEIAGQQRRDEFGQLARKLNEMRAVLAEGREVAAQRHASQKAEQEVLTAVSAALQALAAGNLTTRITPDFPPQFAQLKEDFNETARTLRDTMNAVVDSAARIRAESEDIGRHSDDLSRRTENQAATLEETAAALDELTSSVRLVASDAKEVEKIVNIAQTEAQEGGEVVKLAVNAMSEIENSSNQISTIISVIDDIAFQTNLLALNAGVEAARAGEAGRGFAVVASEVRALAQRSSQAAQEIKSLISGSSQHVARGVELVGKTGTALHAIADRVMETASMMSRMAKGANDQSASLGEINIGVGQLDQVTQQNAGMVEQANAASHSLREQAIALSEIVSSFRIGNAGEEGGELRFQRSARTEQDRAA